MQAEHKRGKLALVAATLPLMAGLCNAPLGPELEAENPTTAEASDSPQTPAETPRVTPSLQPLVSVSPTMPPPATTGEASLTQNGITLFYDPNLILDITTDFIPAELESGPFVEAHPDYVTFSFILDGGSLSVVPVQEYAALSDIAGEELQNLVETIDSGLSQVQGCIPQPPLAAFYTTCSHQQFNASLAEASFQNGSGVRFVTVYSIQDAVPISNEHLTYVFQGFTDDGRYYVSAGFHLTHEDLEDFVSEIPQDVYADTSGEALRQYFEGHEVMLSAAEGRYQPLLSRFDEMLASLRIED